jgi:hypothetical protein
MRIRENEDEEALDAALIEMVSKASRHLDSEQVRKLKSFVFEFKDVWRVILSKDGPAKVTPFAVTLKTDAVPRRVRAPRYSPEVHERNHIEILVRGGCLKWNPHSKGLLQS